MYCCCLLTARFSAAMVGTVDALFVDIAAYTLKEYVPAKPLERNLEVVFAPAPQAKNVQQLKTCGQLSCGPAIKFPFAQTAYGPTSVAIKDARVLVHADEASETKRVVELTLDVSQLGGFEYAPGDTIAILPSNAEHVVAALLQRLDLAEQADATCQVKLALSCAKKNAKVPAHIPAAATTCELFTHCLQLNAVLQKQFLSALASCSSDSAERSFLASLSSKQGSAYYNDLVLEQGLRFLDVLELCPSCKPSLALLVEHLPRLLPRPYSIASSPLECAQELRIVYSIRSSKPGVTTSMLEAKAAQKQKQSAELLIYPRLANAFRYTEQDLASNQILIAVGTGLAPFLGFLAHKQRCRQLATSSGQTWLYLGSKTPAAVLKIEQLQDWQQSALLQRLRMCHSRDPSSTDSSPKYVQQLLEQDADELVELLLHPATVLYVCADGAKISQAIGAGLAMCLQRVLQLDEMAAKQRLTEWRAIGKYREDVWL